MAHSISHHGTLVGFPSEKESTGMVTNNLNSANARQCFSFVPDSNRTLDEFSVLFWYCIGTMASTDIVCELYSSKTSGDLGAPNASLASTTTHTGTYAADQTVWVKFSGLNYAVTGGVKYWIVLKNVNASPTVNYPQIAYFTGGTARSAVILATCGGGASTQGYGFSFTRSTDALSSFTGSAQGVSGVIFGYTGSLYCGMPIYNSSGSSSAVYGTSTTRRMTGSVFTTPAGASMKVKSLGLLIAAYGTPTVDLTLGLYFNGTLYETQTIAYACVPSTQAWITGWFSSAITVPASTTVRIVAASSGTDSGNYYTVWRNGVYDSGTAAVYGMFLFGAKETTTANAGSTWTDTDGYFCPFYLGLDNTGDHFAAAAASGGGPLVGASALISG